MTDLTTPESVEAQIQRYGDALLSGKADAFEKAGAVNELLKLASALSARLAELEQETHAESTRAEVAEAERDRCHERLEITHVYKMPDPDKGDGFEFDRVEVPMSERASIPDAVSCRDASLALCQEMIEEERSRADAAEARLREVTIVAAAVHAYGATWSLPRPARHHHVLWAIDAAGLCAITPGPDAQGFLTSEGRFVGRNEAAEIAVAAGQCPASEIRGGQLFSEEVW